MKLSTKLSLAALSLIGLWHRRNTIVYKAEVDQLMALARSDGHHHGDGHSRH